MQKKRGGHLLFKNYTHIYPFFSSLYMITRVLIVKKVNINIIQNIIEGELLFVTYIDHSQNKKLCQESFLKVPLFREVILIIVWIGEQEFIQCFYHLLPNPSMSPQQNSLRKICKNNGVKYVVLYPNPLTDKNRSSYLHSSKDSSSRLS